MKKSKVFPTSLLMALTMVLSLSGTVHFTAAAAEPKGSISFDGTRYLSSSNMSAPGTGAFTYEFWFYNTSDSATTQVLMNSRQSVSIGQQKDGFDVYISTTRGIGATYKNLGFFYSGDGTITKNRWYHFAIVREGNIVYGYLNGSQIGSVTLDSDGRNLYSQQLWLGSTVNGANKFSGYISNFRYTKSTLYTGNFPLPTDDYEAVANTSILLQTKNDSTFITNAIAGTTFTNNGGATSISRNPFEPTQAQLDAQAAEEARKKRDEERAAEIKATREKINAALVSGSEITVKDLKDADLPLRSVASLNAAYKELTSIKYSLAKPLSTEAAAAIKYKIFMKHAMIERITGISNEPVYAHELVKFGVIDESTAMKQLSTYRLMKLPLSQRDSMQEISEYFTESTTWFESRKNRIVSIINKIRGR